MELLKLHEAAQLAGVSYPTLKQWIYKGKIKSVKTAGGHHRIPKSEIDRLVGTDKRKTRKKPVGLDAISGRNKLFGKITEMRYDGLLAQVSIEIGGQTITSIITSDAARDLDLKKGTSVYALVKATEVMVIRG
ncbi:MAG TPA: helix-turn-helix transcriptional regulator [Blastocatellia bacterium]|jgi:molybdopterin-binding protein|nr:helix-turn-helix transcriptional regulator [Blastocatellia bacterium]